MNRIGMLFAGVLVVGALCYGQGAAAPAAVGHGVLFAKLTKTWDSSKVKEGDAVEVEMASSIKLPDGTLVPKGSKLVGHVTAAKARSKGDPESQLTVAFEKLNILNGKQLMVKGTAQAVFQAPDEPDPGVPGSSAHQGGPGFVPNVESRPTSDIKTGSNTESTAQGADLATDPKSVGAHGIHDLSLEDGVLRSSGKQVKLGSGVRMIVHVDIFQ